VKNKTTKSRQTPVIPEKDLQSARVGDDPPYEVTFKDLESAKKFWWDTQKKEKTRLEREVKIIRKEREPVHAKVAALEGMHPFEELENYTVNARTRVPDHGGLPDRLIAASFSLKPYKKLKEKLAELDQQIEDKEAAINAIRSFGILNGLGKFKNPPAAGVDRPFLPFLRSKATFTMIETARICGVDESTARDTLIEPHGPLKYATGSKRVTGKSIADHIGVSLEE